MSQQRENSGALFREQNRTNDRAPEYTGPAMIGGVEYRVAAWVKDGGKGKFFSLSFEVKGEKPAVKPSGGYDPGDAGGGLDDEIPFIAWGDKHGGRRM
jgi:hypothetical protein